jgi:hypothetical protein
MGLYTKSGLKNLHARQKVYAIEDKIELCKEGSRNKDLSEYYSDSLEYKHTDNTSDVFVCRFNLNNARYKRPKSNSKAHLIQNYIRSKLAYVD